MEEHRKDIKINKLKILQPTWDKIFKLTDGSYSVSDIQNHLSSRSMRH